jgi:hypothetical protein
VRKKSRLSQVKRKNTVNEVDVLTVIEKYGNDLGMSLVYTFCKLLKNQVKNPLKNLIASGNIKIPKDTAIFNMSSATDCASLKLGLCKACVWSEELQKLKTVCYALKSERDYRPSVLPYRRRQEKFWLDVTPEQFVIQFLIINSTKRIKFNKVRLNEAGDFHTQQCIEKAEKIAKLLKPFDIGVYCYTSRDDLDFTKVKHLVVNASGFEAPGIVNEFLMVAPGETPPKGYAKCPQDCTICERCSLRGKKTYVDKH